MAAYVIAQITVTNPEGYQEYASQTKDMAAKYGGRFLAKGGEARWLEGSGHARNVIIEFPDMESAERWFNSSEYRAIAPIRQANSEGSLVLIQGV